MKKDKLANHLMVMALSVCLTCIFGAAQVPDNSTKTINEFGSSLKKTDRKKKDKAPREKQKNPLATENKPLAAENNPAADTEIIRVETVLVTNEVLVYDKHGIQVKGLNKEDFIILEDNQPQEISTFLAGDNELIPRSIVLIIDYSFSQIPYLETSVEAAKVLVDKLNPNDRMAIVTDNVELLQNFTTDKNLLKDKLESIKISGMSGQVGSSKQFSALMATLNEMFDDQLLRSIIIFQTDGDQFQELKGEVANVSSTVVDPINFSFKDIMTATEKTRATIYTVIPGFNLNGISGREKLEKINAELDLSERFIAQLGILPLKPNRPPRNVNFLKERIEWTNRNQSAITKIAKFTGGWTSYLEQPGQAEKIYAEILSKINERYVIGFYPVNQERDGKMRTLGTQVRGHPEYTIISRKSYILR